MIKVGLTGGIGAGKSLVTRMFRALGIPVYVSDIRAKYVMTVWPQLVEAIKKEFGDVYDQYGNLKRQELAKIIFSDREKLEKLNALVHPAVEEDFREWCLEYEDKPYIIKESAILFESGNYKTLDYVIEVYAPEELRILRTQKRDNLTREQVLARIKNQMDENLKVSKADFIIINDGQSALLPQVLNLHKFFLKQNG